MQADKTEARVAADLATADRLLACGHLVRISLRRLLMSRQTLVSLLLLGFAVLVVVAWSLRQERSVEELIEQIVLPVYVSFLLPVFCLCYASISIAGDREEQTLVYLLATPLPRVWIYVAKYLAALLLVLAWTLGGMAILCWFAGSPGRIVLRDLWPTLAWSSLAYVGLFQLFGVMFRRATIIALAYALFLEAFLGNMPGIVKRLAISFYTQCLIFESMSDYGVSSAGPHNPAVFLPVSDSTAVWVLGVLAATFFLAGAWVFARSEYS